ncbi:MAG: response regulator transcription factor [Anaerolineae bacterium]|jgi:DNA-binding response OmpR family regulator|nr:response regulator transcription factor [Anaerolineae bacterium]
MQAFVCTTQQEEAVCLKSALQASGFLVKLVKDPSEMIEVWPNTSIDLVVISIDITGERITQLVSQIRNQANAAIIVIGEMLRERHQIALYHAGADLVLCRPYSSGMLMAQVKALLRRITGVPYYSLPTLTIGRLMLEPSSRSVRIGEAEPQHLTQLEFRLLYTLMTHPGQVLTSEFIVDSVWGYSDSGNRDLVRGLVKRLRGKIEEEPKNPVYIRTISGVGYQFENPGAV